MRTIYVSPEFPLNRRMRKDVRRGKLQVVREGGERSPLGGGIPSGKGRGLRTTGSRLVCMADNGAEVGGGNGGSMDNSFAVDRKTALKLFEGDTRYLVPLYQRRYRWGEEQWGDFWEDIHGEDGPSYCPSYTGNIVLRTGDESGRLEIIDGQQRMTTIVLFVIAAIRVLWDDGKGIHESESPIKEMADAFLAKGGLGDDIQKRMKIIPNQSATADFLANMMRMVIRLPRPTKTGEIDQTNMRNAVEFFMKKLRAPECDSSPQAIGSLALEQVGDNLIFSRVVVGRRIHPHPVFAALNARGVTLKVHELIKDYFFSLCQQREADLEREWETDIVRKIGKGGHLNNGDREMPIFLRAVFTCKYGYVQATRLYHGVREKIRTAADVSDFFREMKKHVSLYRGLVEPSKYKWPRKHDEENAAMLYALQAKRCRPLILAARAKFNESEFSETLKHCYAIYVRNHICGGVGGAANLSELAFHNAAHRVYSGELSASRDVAMRHLGQVYNRNNNFLAALSHYEFSKRLPRDVTEKSKDGRFLFHFFKVLEMRLGNDQFDQRHVYHSDATEPDMQLGNWKVLETRDMNPEDSEYLTTKRTVGMSRDDRQKKLAEWATGLDDNGRPIVPDWRIDCLEGE